MNIKKSIALLCMTLILCTVNGKLKAQSYTFTASLSSSSQYQELVNDSDVTTLLSSGLYMVNEVDAETFTVFNIPYTFGQSVTLSFGKNGFMRFDNDTSILIIDALNTQLEVANASGKISYRIDGNSGELIFKIQYKNMTLLNGPLSNYANFQIWFYQSTGLVEFHYGPRSLNNATGYTTSNGPQVGMVLANNFFSTCHEKIWCTMDPLNPVLNTIPNCGFSALPGVPPDGMIYRFTPTFPVSIMETEDITRAIIFPNPVRNHFTASIPSGNLQEILIFDYSGRKVISKDVNGGSVSTTDVSSLRPGYYFCVIISDIGQITMPLHKATD